MEWLQNIVFWHWWILAGVLLILELTSPVFVFLWLGFAAAAVGFLLLVFPLPLILLSIGMGTHFLSLLVVAFLVQYIGLLMERWFFFAQANHPQNLYYQTV